MAILAVVGFGGAEGHVAEPAVELFRGAGARAIVENEKGETGFERRERRQVFGEDEEVRGEIREVFFRRDEKRDQVAGSVTVGGGEKVVHGLRLVWAV